MNTKTIIAMALTAILTSGAIALAGPIGPSVQSQTNPIRAFTAKDFGKTLKPVFKVPAGKVFIVTDLVLGRGYHSQHQVDGCLYVDGDMKLCASQGRDDADVMQHVRLQSGFPIAAGSTISLWVASVYGKSNLVTVSGYLARP